MGEENRSLLEEEIKAEIKRLGSLESGSQEHTTAVDSLTKLYKLKLEEDKNTYERLTRSRIVKSIRSPRRLKWQSLSKIDTSDLVWLPLSWCCR